MLVGQLKLWRRWSIETRALRCSSLPSHRSAATMRLNNMMTLKGLRQSRTYQDAVRDVRVGISSRCAVARWAPIPLRLIVGYGFMEHGFAKLTRGPDAFATILHALGVPGPHFMAWSTILIEVLGGLAIILGAFVTLAALPMASLLLVAILPFICATGSVRSSLWP